MSTTPIIRALKKDDLPHVVPEGWHGTVRGYVAELDGRIVGSMGVMHSSPPVAFSSMQEEMRKYPRVVVTAIRLFTEMLAAHYEYVVAAASKTECNPKSVLERAGFRQYLKGTEEHRGVYVWQQHH